MCMCMCRCVCGRVRVYVHVDVNIYAHVRVHVHAPHIRRMYTHYQGIDGTETHIETKEDPLHAGAAQLRCPLAAAARGPR